MPPIPNRDSLHECNDMRMVGDTVNKQNLDMARQGGKTSDEGLNISRETMSSTEVCDIH